MPGLQVSEASFSGYRSLRRIRFPLGPLSVFTGANGAGKTNLYRGLQLLQAAAAGTLAQEIAAEGGMPSAMWAGTRRKQEKNRISLMAQMEAVTDRDAPNSDDIGTTYAPRYEIEIGHPTPTAAAFPLEPQIKREALIFENGRKTEILMERGGATSFAKDAGGKKQVLSSDVLATESALSSLRDAGRFPDIDIVRRTLLDWRFYHDFRTDRQSLLREPCLGLTAPTLASDGSNLAAVFATLVHIRQDSVDLDLAIDEAFPGARLHVPEPGRAANFGLVYPDYPKRVFEAHELSDGTLRYLAIAGALLAYRLPAFIALNEPESSLHPSLLEPFARLIVRASRRSQIWLVTHSQDLADAIAAESGVSPFQVIKDKGETWIEGLTLSGAFREDD